jgi:hypothetical protein
MIASPVVASTTVPAMDPWENAKLDESNRSPKTRKLFCNIDDQDLQQRSVSNITLQERLYYEIVKRGIGQ